MQSNQKSQGRKFGWIKYLLLLLVIAGGVASYLRPVAALSANIKSIKYTASPNNPIEWPSSGEAAIGAVGFGLLATHGAQTQKPTASTAKLITSLTVLQKYPLSLGQQGPTITITPSEVTIYNNYLAEDGSVAKVVAGEQITEYQLLEGMMLPSANNMADTLAIWAFGSLPAYKSAAKQYLASHNLDSTTVGADASGFLPSTTSNATDLLRIGLLVLKNPVLTQIVGETSANIPVAGTIHNVNWLLGSNGIIGIKTGNTNQAGGVYVFADKDLIDANHTVTIVGVVEGVPTLASALNDSIPLLNSIRANFSVSTVVYPNQVVGSYNVPWGSGKVNIIASQPLKTITWESEPPKFSIHVKKLNSSVASNTIVGTLEINTANIHHSIPLVISNSISSPPWYWRVFHFHSK